VKNERGVKLSTHLHPIASSSMHVATHPLPHTPSWRYVYFSAGGAYFTFTYATSQSCKPSLMRLQLIRMFDNPDGNTKIEKCCSQLRTYFKRHLTFRKADDSIVTVSANLRYYVQKQVQLLGLLSMNKCIVFLQFLNKGSRVIFLIYLFSSALLISLKFPSISVLSFFFVFKGYLLHH
jgi:hypothetical protein